VKKLSTLSTSFTLDRGIRAEPVKNGPELEEYGEAKDPLGTVGIVASQPIKEYEGEEN
jgi:hypothetical protein